MNKTKSSNERANERLEKLADDLLASDSETQDAPASKLKRIVRVQWPAEKAPIKINAKCPICASGLLLDAGDVCELEEDTGQWIASEIELTCENEPDIRSNKWDEWMDWHYRRPYVDWLPLEQKVLKAVQKKFYFAP